MDILFKATNTLCDWLNEQVPDVKFYPGKERNRSQKPYAVAWSRMADEIIPKSNTYRMMLVVTLTTEVKTPPELHSTLHERIKQAIDAWPVRTDWPSRGFRLHGKTIIRHQDTSLDQSWMDSIILVVGCGHC
jgi:hypothetical protein